MIIQGYYELLRYQPGDELTDAMMKALHRSVLMFAESERFRSAQTHVRNMIDDYSCKCMPTDTSERFTSWGALSKNGLSGRQMEEDDLNELPVETVPEAAINRKINSLQELVGELLLLLYYPGYGI